MAFGDIAALLDNFDRANEDPLSTAAGWSATHISGGTVTLEVASNQAAQLDATSSGTSMRAADFGPDVEAYVTVATLPADADDGISIYFRLKDVGTAGFDGYLFRLVPVAASNQFEINRVDNGAFTVLATGTATFSAGDKVGARITGSVLSMWHYTGAWIERASVSDTTYPLAGKIALGIRDNEARLDDFYAATIERQKAQSFSQSSAAASSSAAAVHRASRW